MVGAKEMIQQSVCHAGMKIQVQYPRKTMDTKTWACRHWKEEEPWGLLVSQPIFFVTTILIFVDLVFICFTFCHCETCLEQLEGRTICFGP